MIVFPTSRRICVTIGIHLQALGVVVWLRGRFQFQLLGQQGTPKEHFLG